MTINRKQKVTSLALPVFGHCPTQNKNAMKFRTPVAARYIGIFKIYILSFRINSNF